MVGDVSPAGGELRAAPGSGRPLRAVAPGAQGVRVSGNGPCRRGLEPVGSGRGSYIPSIRLTWRTSPGDMSVSRPRRRFRTLDFFSRRWERNAFRRRRRPEPVTLMRFARAPCRSSSSALRQPSPSARLVGRGCVPGLLWWCGHRRVTTLWCRRRRRSRLWCRHCCCRGHRCRCRWRWCRRRPGPRLGPVAVVTRVLRRRGLLGPLVRCQHHDHVAAVERGSDSDLPIPSICSAMRSRICLPSSGWNTSRPRNMIVILTLWPSLEELGHLSGLGVEVTRRRSSAGTSSP